MQIKSIIITGSNGSLGFELSKKLSKHNCNLFLHLRNKNKTVESYFQNKKNVKFILGDIRNKNILKKISKSIKLSKSSVLINNCGKYLNKKFIKTNSEEIREIFDVNFFSNIYLLKSILETKNKLLIVNINSVAGVNGSINESVYSASKHALKGLYESIELETRKNIRFLNIFLGAFKSKMTKNRKNYKKLMEPNDLADLISKNIDEYQSCSVNKIFVKRRIF